MKKILSIIFLLTIIGGVWAYYSSSSISVPLKNDRVEEVKSIPSKKVSNEWIDEQMSKMSLREKVGQFFMIAAYSNKDEKHFKEIDNHVTNDRVGGIIFFQGDTINLRGAIERFQGKASIPLLIGMDAEWGPAMRLSNVERYPYNYTIGASRDKELSKEIASMIGAECRSLGVHMNFAPVADVNSNPDNPVIGFRSFGENPKEVAENVVAQVQGMEEQGVLTSIKHFPGHGDTDVDSHKDLPTVNNSYEQINAIDFFPFRSGIKAGASSVMIGHLNVPALDPTGLPSSLSKKIIHNYLKQDLGFEGLVVSDALGMKAVADRYGETEVVVKAFEAGCDILLFPKSVTEAIAAIEKSVQSGRIDSLELDNRCRKVLAAKYKAIIKTDKAKHYSEREKLLTKTALYRKAITVLKNDENLLPIQDMSQKIAVLNIGTNGDVMEPVLDEVNGFEYFHFYNGEDAKTNFLKLADSFDIVISNIYCSTVIARNHFGIPRGTQGFLKMLSSKTKTVISLFGNPLAFIDELNMDDYNSIVVAYENHPIMIEQVGLLYDGAIGAAGKLPISIDLEHRSGFGITLKSGGKLKLASPEEVGIQSSDLNRIDSIALKSIKAKAFPGCQILVAKDGNVIYEKSFGYHTYDKVIPVKNSDLYDIASVTKIAASTLSVMHLESQGKFKLENQLKDYLSELTAGTPYASMNIQYMMAHQAGLFPWIPFYTETLAQGQLDSTYYSTTPSEKYDYQVANGLWSRSDYVDTMYQQILSKSLKAKRYKYSDLGYYFLKKIIEKESGTTLDKYVQSEFYGPMGLKTIRYNAYQTIPLNRIAPTENDTIFRKRQIHGYVHDQGAAMMNGVGGHAGLFSNARDLAAIMQLFLNEGSYGGRQYISPEVVKKYTMHQFYPNNRRGAGFDKPTTNGKGGPCSNQASDRSFGHSGFTGTLVWSDPQYNLTYIFLSNRVYPDAENWKIVSMNIRTEIQDVIYDAIKK